MQLIFKHPSNRDVLISNSYFLFQQTKYQNIKITFDIDSILFGYYSLFFSGATHSYKTSIIPSFILSSRLDD